MRNHRAVVASDEVYGLAEGPLWDPPRQRLLWVDINAGHVHLGALVDGRVVARERLDFAGTVGAVLVAEGGELLVAERRGLTVVGTDGVRKPGPQVLPDDVASRLNDAACDPRGRVLVGSLALDGRTGEESLVRVETGGEVTVVDADLTLSNGIAWSPDGSLLYSVDTVPGLVHVRTYDAATGETGPRRVHLHIEDGGPDGICVDVDGNLWVALWGPGEVRCYSPDGTLLAVVDVPAPFTSSVAFVGPDLNTLLITTASEGLTGAERAEYPDSGRLFVSDVGTTGAPTTPWSGI